MNDNIWRMLVKHVNACYNAGRTTICRRELLSIAGLEGDAGRVTTIDTYRRMLTVIGVLKDTDKCGQYEVCMPIDRGITLRQVRKLAASEIHSL